jgi:ComF family protein
MDWQQLINQYKANKLYSGLISVLVRLKNYLLTLSSCDLCGLDVELGVLASSDYKQGIICSYCLKDLPLFKQDVVHGNLLMWPAIHRALPRITFDSLFSLAPYTSPFDQWLAQFKYHGRFELGNMFAVMLANQWELSFKGSTPDIVVAVPLHINKWQIRGYNQADLIARPFAKILQLTYLPNALMRIKHNESQMGKTGTARRKNLSGAFKLNLDMTGIEHVLLIDDVVTTGTTASELSTLLKKSGVKIVTLATVCLTLPKT